MALEPEVHWEEGMFLRAQHLQSFDRSIRSALARASLQAGVQRYGVIRLSIDLQRIVLFEFAVAELVATFADGTSIAVPGNAELDGRDFRDAFERAGGRLDVFVGMPIAAAGTPVTSSKPGAKARYGIVDREVVDENTGLDAEPMRMRVLRPRLLFGGDDHDGYALLKVAEITRAGDQLDLRPVLSEAYVPPLLELGGDRGLSQRLQALVDQLRHADERLAAEVARRPVGFSIEAGADPEALWKLAATNAALALLEPLCACVNVHPFEIHLALCHAIGGLAMFGEGRALPRLPRYDHANLGPVFARLTTELTGLLRHVFAQGYQRQVFVEVEADRNLMVCRVEKDWLDRDQELYLGIEGDLGNLEALDAVVTGRLKLSARNDVSVLRASVQPGILLRRVSPPPLALPSSRKIAYYRLLLEESRDERVRALKSTAEAALFCTAGALPPFQFFLYVTGANKAPPR